MTRWKVALLTVAVFSLMTPVASCLASLGLYDDFAASQIDAAKWQNLEQVREIRDGKLVLSLRQATYPQTPSNFLQFTDPGSIQSFQADVRLTAYTPPAGGSSRARLRGTYYNDGVGTSGATGDVRAELYLRGTTSGVDIRYRVYKCTNSDCTSSTDVVPTTTVRAAALGETHTLSIAWNGAVFTFGVDGADTVVTPTDCGTYPTCQAIGKASPNVVEKNLSAQLSVGGAGSVGYAAGEFDNVYVNGTLYDTFDGDPYSGPQLDPGKWSSLDLVCEIQNGKLVSKVAYTGETQTSLQSASEFMNQHIVTAGQAETTVTAYQSTNTTVESSVIAGKFYNDGTSTGGGDYTGDIGAFIRIRSSNGGPLTVVFSVDRCANAQCTSQPSFFSDNITTVNLGDPHTLFLIWDGSVFTYGITDLGITRTFDPTPGHPVAKPAVTHLQRMRTRVYTNAADAYGYIAATFENVYVNSDALTLPRLAPAFQQIVTGDVVSAGVGLRGTGAGTISLTGIPGGASIQKAFLYWATLGTGGTFTAPTLNGTPVSGALIGQSDDPFWGGSQSYAYKADVTSQITGNGSYAIAGLPALGPTVNDSQGASLVVLYSVAGAPARRIVINDGAVTLSASLAQYCATTLSGFVAATPPAGATLTFVVGDGQSGTPEYAGLNSTLLATSGFAGSDGHYWDTRTYDISAVIAPGATTANAIVSTAYDALVWVAAILSVPEQMQQLYADFPGSGLNAWSGSSWNPLTGDHPASMVASGSTLYAGFADYGLNAWNGSAWTLLSPVNPAGMVALGSTLYADFAGYGLYSWNGSAWTLLSPVNPASMVASGSTLYAGFADYGLYSWNGTAWTLLSPVNPASMVALGSTLYADFAGYGLNAWNGSAWTLLSPVNPASMVASGSTLYAGFADYGLNAWNGSAWTLLSPVNPAGMVALGSTLYADFAGYGLYSWNGSAWTLLSPVNPAGMVALGSTLYAGFAGYGLYSWNGTAWTQINSLNPASMLAGF